MLFLKDAELNPMSRVESEQYSYEVRRVSLQHLSFLFWCYNFMILTSQPKTEQMSSLCKQLDEKSRTGT